MDFIEEKKTLRWSKIKRYVEGRGDGRAGALSRAGHRVRTGTNRLRPVGQGAQMLFLQGHLHRKPLCDILW